MTNTESQFDRLERLIEAALHTLDQTDEADGVALFVDTFVIPVVAKYLDNIVHHRHALARSQDRVVHYTSVPSLFSMFDDEMIRLYDSDNSNDPGEGAIF